ncbi:MAG: CHAT domain-containing protein [Acidobacteriota bacterium]
MKRFKVQILHAAAAIALLVFLASIPVGAQPERAEALFEEATVMAAGDSTDAIEGAVAKFKESVRLFSTAGNATRAAVIELEHGRALRNFAVRRMNASQDAEAIKFFDRSIEVFRRLSNFLELAFAYHDLGFIASRGERLDDSARYDASAIENYRAAKYPSGEASVKRNLALIISSQGKRAEAMELLESAVKLRSDLNDVSGVAELKLDIGDLHRSSEKLSDAVVVFGQGLTLYRQAKDRTGEAAALFRLGSVQATLRKFQVAIANLQAAYIIYGDLNDVAAAADAVLAMGRAQVNDAQSEEAERSLTLAVKLFAITKNTDGEAAATLDRAINYQAMSRSDESRVGVERAIKLFREVDNKRGEAYALLAYSDVDAFLNKHDEALVKIEAARKLFLEFEPENADNRVAHSLANHYYAISNHGESIRYSLIALEGSIREKNDYLTGNVYVDIGNSYSALNQLEKSAEYTTKALELARKLNSPYMESVCLSNLGYVYLRVPELAKAQTYFEDAIRLMEANKYDREKGYAIHNLGLVFYKRRNYAKALELYERAMPIYRKAGDRRPEAFLYDSLGETYRDLGQYDNAIENLQKAIVLAREIKYGDVEATALGDMMTLWARRKQPRLGILYGKQAVNGYQAIRANARSLEKSAQKSFIRSNEKTYRQLANLLIDEGRLAEAQQVLDLLKAEEYFDFVRRDAAEADDQAMLALNETERKALEEYSRVSASLTSLGTQFQVLTDKRIKANGKLPDAEEAQYLRLKNEVEGAGEGMRTFFTKLTAEFSKKVEDGTVITPQSIETLKADLRRVGPDVVLVSTYLLPERYRAIVTTGRAMVDRKVEYSSMKLTGADINRKIFEFQRALQNPNVDPRKLGKELYDIFVKPLENDLRGAGAKTILWSLDGSLRYIPLAALSPDGKTYLAERYQNVVVTLGRQTSLFAKPSGEEWRAIGAGVSKPHAGFSALPSVPEEIGSIVRDDKATTGILSGMRMLDEQFNLESLRNTVPQQTDDGKTFNVLHLATHFSLGANDQDSALLLGDGTRLSLFDIGRDEALDFKDVELLTLSACQTGVSTGDANGREVESLGMLAQKKGAKAVLATLWKVADESTSLFMTEFYRIKKANPTMNKAEAIRLAQKEMIDGKIKASGKSNGCRAETFGTGAKKDEFKCDPNAPFSHPYFWSPFVLIGNWR